MFTNERHYSSFVFLYFMIHIQLQFNFVESDYSVTVQLLGIQMPLLKNLHQTQTGCIRLLLVITIDLGFY